MYASSLDSFAMFAEQDTPTPARRGVLSTGHGQPVVMLHAAISSKLQWAALADRLASSFQAIAVDLHGYGDNPLPPQPDRYGIDDEVDLVRERVAAVVQGDRRLHLVGHSFGGLIALQFAQRHPEAVASLTLYEPITLGLLGYNDLGAGAIRHLGVRVADLVQHDRAFEAAELAVDFWSRRGCFARLPLSAQASAIASTTQAALDFARIISKPMRLADVQAIRVPTLLLGGRHSPQGAQRCVSVLSAALPNAGVQWLDADHMAPITAAAQVNPVIEDFLVSQLAHEHVAEAAP